MSHLNFLRYATQRPGLLIASIIAGFIAGIAYRSFVDAPDTRDLANHLRSGLHRIGIALAGWNVQAGFASSVRSPLGLALRRLPLLGEVLVRSAMANALPCAAAGNRSKHMPFGPPEAAAKRNPDTVYPRKWATPVRPVPLPPAASPPPPAAA
jgi:hypothetical protein